MKILKPKIIKITFSDVRVDRPNTVYLVSPKMGKVDTILEMYKNTEVKKVDLINTEVDSVVFVDLDNLKELA